MLAYSVIAEAYEKIEGTTGRQDMTHLLVTLLTDTPKSIIDKIVYLTQGKVCPDFVGLEIGMAEKLVTKALAKSFGVSERDVKEDLTKTGDLGETAQKLAARKKQMTFSQRLLTAEVVHETLYKMAKSSGTGAANLRTALLSGLLADATPKEAKYIVRTVTGNLRLGIADMTVLDALAVAYGNGKESRQLIERAYNVSSDLGQVAKVLAEHGLQGLRKFKVAPFEPIKPMLAERLSSSREIIDRLGGRCMAEYKYDGERVQIHKKGDDVSLFSRRLERISGQYPDAIEQIRKQVTAEEAILESEFVAINPDTGEMRPFQELMHRRRKYGIAEAVSEYPVAVFMFDALYIDGKDLTLEPYPERRELLERSLKENDRVRIAKHIVAHNESELESFFLEAVEEGCEGLVCKSMNRDSVYQAGARGWLWIKYKRDYKSEMTDTVDLVAVGAFHGRGKRAGAYGALLLAAYAPETDMFETVTKCGTGFTDEDLEKMPKMLAEHVLPHKHARVRSILEADIWVEPVAVFEILGAEVTLSPIHTCATGMVAGGRGLAIRFPRFTGNYRTDKAAEDATTSQEICLMYRNQLKRIDKT